MSRMSRSLTPSAYSPGRGQEDRGGRTEERTLGGAERTDRVTSSPRHRPRTAPHDPCSGQQCSRDRGLPAVTSGLNQAPSLRAQASNGAPATNPASILHLSFYWTACCPRPCAGTRGSQRTSQPLPSRSPQAQGEGGGESCEQRIRAQFEALNGGSLSSCRRGSKLAEAGEGQQGGWETVLSSRHLGWTSEPQLTPAEFSAPSQLLGQERRALLGAQRRLRRGRPLWSPELWVTQVRRIAGLRGADSLPPWAAPSFSSPLPQTGFFIQGTPKEREPGPTSEKLLLGIPSQSPSPPSLWDTVMKARGGGRVGVGSGFRRGGG